MTRRYVFKKAWKRCFAAAFDFIGSVLTLGIHRNRPISTASIKKILFARIDHLGDALLLRPALYRFREKAENCAVHVLTTPENAAVFELDPFINKVISFQGHWFQKFVPVWKKVTGFFSMVRILRQEKYDMAIDFRGDVRMAALFFLVGIPIRVGYGITGGGWMLTHEKIKDDQTHQVLLNAGLLTEWGIDDGSIINPPVRYPADIQQKINKKWVLNNLPYVVIHSGAGNPLKEWPGNYFIDLIDRLISTKKVKTFLLVGSAGEKNRLPMPSRSEVIDLRGMTNLHEMACLLEKALFFVGNDSGPAHLAAAQGIPVAVFGNATNDMRVWHPWTKKLQVLQSKNAEFISVDDAARIIEGLLTKKNETDIPV